MAEEETDLYDNFDNESFDFAPEGNDALDASLTDDLHSLDIGPISGEAGPKSSGAPLLSMPRALSVIAEESRIETGPTSPVRSLPEERMAAGIDNEESSAFGSSFNAVSFRSDLSQVQALSNSDEFAGGGLAAIEAGERSFYKSPGRMFIQNDPRFNHVNNVKENSWELSPPSYMKDRHESSAAPQITPKKSSNSSFRRVARRNLSDATNKDVPYKHVEVDVDVPVETEPSGSPLKATSRFVNQQQQKEAGPCASSTASPQAVMNASKIKASTPNGRPGSRAPPLLCDVSAINAKAEDSPGTYLAANNGAAGNDSVFGAEKSSINYSVVDRMLDDALANKTSDDLLAVLENLRKNNTKRVTPHNFSVNQSNFQKSVPPSTKQPTGLPPKYPSKIASESQKPMRSLQPMNVSARTAQYSTKSGDKMEPVGGKENRSILRNPSEVRTPPRPSRPSVSPPLSTAASTAVSARPSSSVSEFTVPSRPVSSQSRCSSAQSRPNTGMSGTSSNGTAGPLRVDRRLLAFGFVEVGDCVRENMVVANRTNSRLRIKLTLRKTDSDYHIPNGNLLSLDAGESRTIVVEFKPSTNARIHNTLTISIVSGIHSGCSHVVRICGSGGIASLCVVPSAELAVSSVTGAYVLRTCSRSGVSLKVANKGVRPGYCKLLVMHGDKQLSDCHISPTSSIVLAKKKEVSFRVDIPQFESYFGGQDFRSSTNSLDSHNSSGRRSALSSGGQLRLILFWGEETQRQRLKKLGSLTREDVSVHGIRFDVPFMNEEKEFVVPPEYVISAQEKPVFELGLRKTEIVIMSANAVLREYTHDGDLDATFGPDSTMIHTDNQECTMFYDVSASASMLKK